MEGLPTDKIYSKTSVEELEEIAQEKLDKILEDSDNKFLTEIPQNLEQIESAPSSQEALSIAEELILMRLERTFKIEPLGQIEGFDTKSVDFRKMHAFLDWVKNENRFVGEGGYATVVASPTDDVIEMPTEVCYKIAKDVYAPDLSSLAKEAEVQEDVFEVLGNLNNNIGVPQPIYLSEIGNTKVFAMEKLPALSLKDLKDGKGQVPEWFDIDLFCMQLRDFIDQLHEKRLYHRDLHEGNIMIRQSDEEPADGKHSYVIDFGFSDYCDDQLENPYQKEVNGKVFTYLEDYAIIEKAKKLLTSLKKE